MYLSSLLLTAGAATAHLMTRQEGGACDSGQPGVCLSTSSCGGTSTPGFCPGPSDIQCCTYGGCNAGGVDGQCIPTGSCTGTATPGLCPGPSDIQCCTSGGAPPPPPSGCGAPPLNSATLDLIKEFEGYEPEPYDDPTGNPTIGTGHLCDTSDCSEIPYPIPLSDADGEALLESDAQEFRDCITSQVAVPLNDNQYGALVSWAFNVGCGNSESSSLVSRLNAGEDPDTVAAEELPEWNTSNGETLEGLTRRRDAEVALFQTASGTPAIPPAC